MAPREPNSSSSRGRFPPVTMQILTPTRAPLLTPPKMSLPIELLEQIVDYMSVQTQLRFARTSHAMRDMIYDDTRWVTKLKAMGCWNEEEARIAVEEEITARREVIQRAKEEAILGRPVANGGGSTTLFDVNVERKRMETLLVTPARITGDLLDFQSDSPEAFGEFQSVSPLGFEEKSVETVNPLNILSSVVSRRGQARSEFERVYTTLAPLYIDLANSNSLDEAVAFRHRRQPEEQAKILKVLELFGRAMAVDNWTKCQKRIAWITETFERQMLTEFEEYAIPCRRADFRAYDAQDIDGKMKRYAYILYDLNGGESGIRIFIRKHPSIFHNKEAPMACLTYHTS